MSIQYAGGTNVNATLTQSTGTRAELAQWIRDQLIVAGWTSSGSATDYQLTSATTPQSLSGRVRVYDPGSGSCARLKFSNVGGTKTQTGDIFLLPAAAKVWRIVANKYQLFVMTPGNNNAREFGCGGVPYLPSFLNGVITECVWGISSCWGDTDTAYRETFRSQLQTFATGSGPNQFGLVNGNMMEVNGSSVTGNGSIRLVVPVGANTDQFTAGYRWHDDSQLISDALIAWDLTIPGATGEAKIRGQLWDAAILSDAWTPDTIIQLDSANPTYNFIIITGNNIGTSSSARGSLCVRTS